MNQQLKRIAVATVAALGVAAAGVTVAEPTTQSYPAEQTLSSGETVVLSAEPIVTGDASTPEPYVAADVVAVVPDEVILGGIAMDAAGLASRLEVASHPAAQQNPQPPEVPVNLETGYVGAPLIESRGE